MELRACGVSLFCLAKACKSYTSLSIARLMSFPIPMPSYAEGKIKGKRKGGVPRGRSLLLVDPR